MENPYEEVQRKVEVFGRMADEGVEAHYNPHIDELCIDVNETLSDKNLAMLTMRHLDEEVAEAAQRIMATDRPHRVKVLETIGLFSGRTEEELKEASKKAVDETEVPGPMAKELIRLKPTKLTPFTRMPKQTADIYIERKVDPIYNCRGPRMEIVGYATVLEQKDGVITGRVEFIPDNDFRELYKKRPQK